MTTRAYARCPSSLRSQTSTVCAFWRTQTTLPSCGAGWVTHTSCAWPWAIAGTTTAATTMNVKIPPRAPTGESVLPVTLVCGAMRRLPALALGAAIVLAGASPAGAQAPSADEVVARAHALA